MNLIFQLCGTLFIVGLLIGCIDGTSDGWLLLALVAFAIGVVGAGIAS